MPFRGRRTYRRRRGYRRNRLNRGDYKSIKLLAKQNRKNRQEMMRNTARKSGDIIAPFYITPMDYVENAVAFSGGVFQDIVYRGNGLFDPSQTGIGHQPLGYDQLAALYFSYRCYGSKITINLMPDDSTVDRQNLAIVIVPSNVSTAFTSITNALEQPYARSQFTNLYSGRGKLSNYMPTAMISGVRRQVVEIDDAFAALSSTVPSNQWFWHVCVGTLDETATVDAHAFIKIRYYAEWWNRIPLSGS